MGNDGSEGVLLGAGGLVATAVLPACADDATVFPSRGRYERLSLAYQHVKAGATQPFSILHISDTQMGYVTDVEPGHGLLRVAGAVIPFDCTIPKDTELYRLMNTNPGHV